MARGGGGGGRGGGGGGRFHGRSHGYSRPMTGTEKILFFPALIVILLFSWCSENSGTTTYSESAFSSYCETQYAAQFGETESYEDNLLLTVLVYEDRSDYSYMTWVGDHINDETFELLRGEGTRLDSLLESHIQMDYTYTLASNLASAIRALAAEIDEATASGSLTCAESRSENPSLFCNYSDMELNAKLLNAAIADFRETTGIPLVVIVEDAAEVFG